MLLELNKIKKAKSNIPVRQISLVNFGITVAVTLFALTFSLIMKHDSDSLTQAITISSMSIVITLLTSFTNLGLCILTEPWSKNASKYKLAFVLISNTINTVIAIIIVFIYGLIRDVSFTIGISFFIIVDIVILNTLVLMMQNFVLVNYAKTKAEIENSRLKVANVEASNQLLRQQIHPHLLFNALSILLSLIMTDTKAAEKYLINLSDFLRRSISNQNKKIVKIEDELKFCNEYIELQKVRFGDALSYSVDIPEEIQEEKSILAFSIQPLVENAIKHNELTSENPLVISIKEKDGWIKVSNRKQIKRFKEVSTETGLANLSERYRLLANEDIIIEDNDLEFSVILKIIENENNYNRR
ncbi:histidine kinase [Draconibacterium sp. IB214405]|uniref:sensor histidine kinase n=1 Tax=Draconibacterium sp. IB214405 TaxID=3097352 RepID=UPI002A16B7A7|nr:histidine kinase [Draconibacterium sp. IB214405]MDX8341145.1 histidine kinase [Draconibacterium sp. IB214405]